MDSSRSSAAVNAAQAEHTYYDDVEIFVDDETLSPTPIWIR